MGVKGEKGKSRLPKQLPVTKPKTEFIAKGLPISKPIEGKLVFSYKYFKCNCLKDKEFNNCYDNPYKYAEWITFYIKRIADLSTMSLNEINNSGKSLRFHLVKDIELEKLKRILSNLGLEIERIFTQHESENYYELSFGTGNGRMFGYLIGNIYFVLLLDPNHLLYANLAKGAKLDLFYKNYNPWENLLEN